MGKKEIMDLAKRLKVSTHDRTRANAIARIRERL
jgi:hypothetical protein